MNAVQQVRSCPKPQGRQFSQDHFKITRDARQHYDVGWVTQRLTGNAHVFAYAFRIARADNVLVVIESTGVTDDRSQTILSWAVRKALPQYHRSR